jgi:hypothetical protein
MKVFKTLALTLFLLLMPSIASALSVGVLTPVQQSVSNSTQVVNLGLVGPGQKVEVTFGRSTQQQVSYLNSSYYGFVDAVWDKANVVSLPSGWSSSDSLYYETPLTIFVFVSPNASNGNYDFTVQFLNEYQGVAPFNVTFQVTVSTNVIQTTISPSTVATGVGQPAVYALKVQSLSSADDIFEVSATGLPYDWQFTKTFFLQRDSNATVYYEVIGSEQKSLTVNFHIQSLSSGLIYNDVQANLVTTTSLIQEMQSVSAGVPLFPSIEQTVYSLIGLMANIFK